MGEWFHIVERFGGFLSLQLWHVCVGLVLGHWQVLVGFAWLESDGSPFLIVGVVSLVRRAVLHSFAPGLQSEETPDLDPELISLQCHYLWC